MPLVNGIDYPDTYGGVAFLCGQNQSMPRKTEFADEKIVGGAVTGTSFVYRDWFANPPDPLDTDILVPDRATFEALAALRGYPVDTGGIFPELDVPAQGIAWIASLDEITAQGAYMDTPLRCHAVWTKIMDVASPAGAGPVTVTASFVFGPSGLTVGFDANGSTSSDGVLDQVNWEFGDTNIATQTGPWDTGGSNIPVQNHTYAAPGAYVVNCSVERNGVTSSDFSVVVVVS